MRKNLPVTTNEYVLPASEVIVTHTDLKGRVTYASDGFVRASGYSRKECMGQPHNFVRHPDMPAAGFADLWDTIQKGRPWTGLVKNRRKNGDYYWVRANASPIMRDGQIVGYMSVRTAPSRAEIQAAEALYAAINEGRANHLRLSGGILYHTGWRGQVEAILNLPLAIRLWMTIGGLGALFIALACGEWLSGGKYALLLTIVELASATLAFASAAYMSHRLAGPMNDLIATAKRICAGEIRLRFEETGDSEVVQFARLLNQMNANLAGVLTDVNGAFEHVDRATMEVAQGNIDLSSRTEEQASSLEETASAMEQLTSSVKQNADHAKHSNQLTASASEVAIEGGNAVREVVHTMSAISESSKKIANIIGVIDGIAFQTNILALNAAVEAARAGEQGRGFAVVASEVRNLAQRSAAAAKEIKELIAESGNKVDAGTRQVHEAGETMDHIVSSVRRVTDIMAEITAATLEQSQGIEEMSTAVQQMDEVTQQNAALVEEAAAAAESLREQGEQIGIAIGVFNFGTGRADKRGSASAKPTTKAHAEKTAIPRLPAAPTPSPAAGETEWEEF